MKRAQGPTPRLKGLRRSLKMPMARAGGQSELARVLGRPRQQIHRWFVRGEGRPPAEVTMAALRWAVEGRRRKDNMVAFVPTWNELATVLRLVLARPKTKARLAEHCRVSPSRISRYFRRVGARQPDGEFALRAWEWVLMVKQSDDFLRGPNPVPSSENWHYVRTAMEQLTKLSQRYAKFSADKVIR
jgi:hypothetical protein